MTFLTTVVGLIGVYIACALVASWANELVATALDLRSKTLIAGIKSMIGEAASTDFFGHPLIVSLGETYANGLRGKLATGFGLKFAFESVPIAQPRTVAQTQTLVQQQTSAQPQTLTQPQMPAQPQTTPASGSTTKVPPYVSGEHFAAVVTDLLLAKAQGDATVAELSNSTALVAAGINSLDSAANPYQPFHAVLLPIWRDARGDFERFEAGVASWYDTHMDRVSGWYKRSVQIILVYIGLTLAVAFNVDTLQIVHELMRNAALANGVAAATQAYYAQARAGGTPGNPAANVASAFAVTQPCQGSGACTCDSGYVPDAKAKPAICRIDEAALAALPIGWNGQRWRDAVSDGSGAFALKLLGFAITTLAILLGAPFWFDVLGAIVNVRSAGAKPLPAATK